MESVRLDIWLDVACLFRTRSEAQKACKAGKVDVNGQPAKPHREITSGDEVVISRPLGRKQRLVVYAVADKHVARKDARALYEDLTPRRLPRKSSSAGSIASPAPSCARKVPGRPTSANEGNCAR